MRTQRLGYLFWFFLVFSFIAASAWAYFSSNKQLDFKAQEIPKITKNIAGLISEEDIKKFGEFLGVEFQTEAWRIINGQKEPMVYVATIPSLKNGISYNVRFWNHHANTYLEAQDRVGMDVWVDDMPGASFSAEVHKVAKYEFDRIWLKFDSADGQAIVITKWHPSDKNYKRITNKVLGYSVQISSARYFD